MEEILPAPQYKPVRHNIRTCYRSETRREGIKNFDRLYTIFIRTLGDLYLSYSSTLSGRDPMAVL